MDADRRALERALHDGLQQKLVGLAVDLQLVSRLVEDDVRAAKTLLDDIARQVQHSLEDATRLAERIYPSLLEGGGLGPALRAAVASGDVAARVDVGAGGDYPPEVAQTVYRCCLAALDGAAPGTTATVSVREEDAVLVFEVVASGPPAAAPGNAELEGLRDRVEALGGRLTIERDPASSTSVRGSLPVRR